ncbi:uncharacterized protein LOC112575047 [Pomacea canaliculata]|uniref:uncharacterized protein LOC112575047 n=1 Tax=Pomacea canaliculata TaxID=400727 RepID=UPI000D726879|nr:uncharacterized protein LOC112575047 [Pomacea canaliculata]
MAETYFRSWETSSLIAALVLVVSLHLCLSSFSAAVLAQETTSSCHISSVKEAEPTNITCTFRADVFAAKNNIKILHFVDEDSEGARVALCSWLEEGLHCNTASGYEFTSQTLKDGVVIRVPRASRDQSGRYACTVPSSASTRFASCNLIVMTG